MWPRPVPSGFARVGGPGCRTTSASWETFLEERLKRLTRYECSTADVEESKVHLEMRALRSPNYHLMMSVAEKVLVLLIGFTLACLMAAISLGASSLHRMFSHFTQAAFDAGDHVAAGASIIGLRLACVMAAAALATLAPSAAGSGLPQVKSNLNGADIPGFFGWKTLLAKTIGITLVVSTGLPLGKEGPMVHIGAMVASVLSRIEIGPMRELLELRLPAAQRQWVGMGAAAGVAAAFHAPLGGILYAFEEVCSHWSSHLTWRSFMCVVIVIAVYNLIIELADQPWLHADGFVTVRA